VKKAGFTLLEVLVATVIMGVAVAGLIAGLSHSVRNAARLTDYDRAAMLARTKMNDLLVDKSLPFDGTDEGQFEREQSGGVPSGWRASLRPFDVPPHAGPGVTILQRISLEIWWEPVTGTRRTIQLESYRPVPIPVPAPTQ
jgi:general secretion pathway protein I